MTKRDTFLSAMRREGAHAALCDLMLSPPKLAEYGRRHPDVEPQDYFDMYHRTAAVQLLPGYEGDGLQLFPGRVRSGRFSVDPWGIGNESGSDAAFHMVHFHGPLEGARRTEREIADFPVPRIPPGSLEDMEELVRATRQRGLATVASMQQTIWERAWLIRGMNDLMMDMATEDGRATLILDKMTEHARGLARLYAEAGFDVIMLGDDIGMQSSILMSVPLWRKWLKPRLGKVIETIRAVKPDTLVFYHSCGFVEPFIPELIELDVDILNPLQPECMGSERIMREYGRDISFWGGIGTQTTLPFGSPRDVRDRVFELVAQADAHARGGLVVSPTHIVEPEVPWENLEAYRDAVFEARERG